MTDQQGYVIRIYAANNSAEMQELIKVLVDTLKAKYPAGGNIELIDVLEHPERATEENIFATPSVVKEFPEPARRILGTVNDPKEILLLLGLFAASEP
ncbi:MAG: hypothetical protein M0R77_16715 [Gammaproteobacteria bacterium]|nr:hypothetical protein [Gammaproteobacteria bacterium]